MKDHSDQTSPEYGRRRQRWIFEQGLGHIGQRLPAPLILAPIGVLEMAHSRADLAAARAAAAERVPFVFSNQASVAMETCATAMGDGIRWLQLYWSTDDRLVISFLRRAEACGCGALVLTLDTPLLGWPQSHVNSQLSKPIFGLGLLAYEFAPAETETKPLRLLRLSSSSMPSQADLPRID